MLTERNYLHEELTHQIIAAAINVHRELGPGLLESAYEACLIYLLRQEGYKVEAQVKVPVKFRGVELDCAYRLDILVEDAVILEIKTIEQVMPIHEAQLLTYLRLTKLRVGLLLNFNVPVLKDGIRRLIL